MQLSGTCYSHLGLCRKHAHRVPLKCLRPKDLHRPFPASWLLRQAASADTTILNGSNSVPGPPSYDPASPLAQEQHPNLTTPAIASAQLPAADGSTQQGVASNAAPAAGSSPAQHATEESAAGLGQGEAPKPKTKKGGNFSNRLLFGIMLGLAGGAIVTVGKLPFLAMVILITYIATHEYYGFINAKGIAQGMAPPPPLVSTLSTILCTSIALVAYFIKGRSGTVLAVAAFLLLVLQVIINKRPKFAQLASSLFGLFYCGWLPSFWVKLRMLATPAPTIPYTGWIGSFSAWTVGLVATFTTVACVIAADTGAYFVGKNLGRTKLTEISPKKTVEGALGGLASSVGVAVGLWKVTHWPATPLAAAGLGVLVFFSSLFGDLIESIMKRDAGMKDSGNLIPGHGGLLDRLDSYMFTGAVTYFYCVFVLPFLT